ncbi:MAG: lipocalin family protein [Holophagaceae bacterium]|nr:lipocalin family protein [Holophagaceae bacterium]
MTNKVKPHLAALFALLLALFIPLGASSSNDIPLALVGRWTQESTVNSRFPRNIELYKDGTGISDSMSITWKVEGKRLVMLSSLRGQSYDYNVAEAKLTLSLENLGSASYANRDSTKPANANNESDKLATANERDRASSDNVANVMKKIVVAWGDARLHGLPDRPSHGQVQKFITEAVMPAITDEINPWETQGAMKAYNPVVVQETSFDGYRTKLAATPAKKGQVQFGYFLDPSGSPVFCTAVYLHNKLGNGQNVAVKVQAMF